MPLSYSLYCCLCRRPIGAKADVYALDGEWKRRYPEMVGYLACKRCAVDKHSWKCLDAGGRYVENHIGLAKQSTVADDLDSWDHLEQIYGTREHMVLLHPGSGLLQGAEEFARATAESNRCDQALVGKAREALAERYA